MAELPDLTVFAQILSRRFKRKVLDNLDITVTKKLNVSAAALKSALEGRELTGVSREGKPCSSIFQAGRF